MYQSRCFYIGVALRELRDVQTVFVLADVLAEVVAADVLRAVVLADHDDVHRNAARREAAAQLVAEPCRDAVAQERRVHGVGDQHPVLVFAEAEQIRFLVELDLERELAGLLPCGVAAPANAHVKPLKARSREVGEVRIMKVLRHVYAELAVAVRAVISTVDHVLDRPARLVDVQVHDRDAVVHDGVVPVGKRDAVRDERSEQDERQNE